MFQLIFSKIWRQCLLSIHLFEMVKRISTVSEAMDFLHNTEKQNRDSIKHVILDCSATLGMVSHKI